LQFQTFVKKSVTGTGREHSFLQSTCLGLHKDMFSGSNRIGHLSAGQMHQFDAGLRMVFRFEGALHKKCWAVIDRPYSLGFATVGALYERPRCISCAKPFEGTNHKRHKDDHKKAQEKSFVFFRLPFVPFCGYSLRIRTSASARTGFAARSW